MIYLIAPWLAAALPGLISVAGGIIGRAQSRGDIAKQNAYNSPINQVRRLREAGLPYAALEGGHAGEQSQLPQNIGESISKGGESIGAYMSTTIQKKQLELLDAQIKATNMGAINTEQEAQGRAIDNQQKMLDPMSGDPISYSARTARLDIEIRTLQRDIARSENQIRIIDMQVKRDLNSTGHLAEETRQRIKNMALTWDSMKQAYDNTENQMKAVNTMIEQLEKGGMSVGEAFMFTLQQGMFSRMQPIQYYQDK